jgi:hypothetical protein
MLEISAQAIALLDDPLDLHARGGVATRWRARLIDDDGRSWRTEADSPEALVEHWAPAKDTTGPTAALGSLRPIRLDVRAETEAGPAANRTLERRLLADAVKVRRWRAPAPTATLFLPTESATGALLIDARESHPATLPAGALLASRGVVALVVTDDDLAQAAEMLASVPAAAGLDPMTLAAAEIGVPPGIPATAAGDAAKWDELLALLGAEPRRAK